MRGATDDTLLQHTQAIADTCVRAARESLQLLSQCWIGGGFHDFNYSYVQYLFSAAVILAIASTLETSQDDNDEFNLAASFLHQLERNGNFAAMEFHSHVKETQRVLEQFPFGNRQSGASLAAENPGWQPAAPIPSGNDDHTAAGDVGSAVGGHDLETGLPMDLSFLDDWIYENALEQLCWEGQS